MDDTLREFFRKRQFQELVMSFLPREIIKRVALRPKELDRVGERREVTALFADISGFTAISERLDPEEVMGIVNAFFGELLSLVERFGGTVDKFLGDGIMILFGVPHSHSDDARRALELALEFLDAVENFNKKGLVFGSERLTLELSIGINTGMVVAGILGSDFHREYTVLGDTVNLAARLESLAKRGEIIVGERTFELTKDYFYFKPLESLTVKGKTAPVNAYQLLGRKRLITLEVKRPVGREAEIKKIQAFVTKKDRNLLFLGEQGTGKSHLLAYAIDFAKKMGRSSIYHASLPWEKRLHLSASRAILRSIIEHTTEKNIASYIPAAHKPYLSLLNDIVDTNFKPTPQVEYLSPEERSARVVELIFNLIHNFLHKSGLFLVLDALENFDNASLNIIARLGAKEKGLIIASANASFDTARFKTFSISYLKPLKKNDVLEFLKSHLGPLRFPQTLVNFLYEQSEGLPLYLQELFSYLKDEGFIELKGKRLIFRTPGERISGGITNLFLIRLDHMDPHIRELVQTASVLGLSFPLPVLEHLYHGKKFERELDFLQERNILSVEVKGALNWATFRNQIFQSAVYSSLLLAVRERIHLNIANTFCTIFTQKEDEFASTIAYHYLSGKEHFRAGEYYLKASSVQEKLYAHKEALFFLDKAEEVFRSLRVDERVKKALLRLYHGRFKPLWFLGMYERALEDQIHAYALAKQLKEYDKLAEALLGIGLLYSRMGKFSAAEKVYKKGLEFARSIPYVQVEILSNLGILRSEQFDFNGAKGYYEKALEIAKKYGFYTKVADIYNNLGWISMKEGNYEQAIVNFGSAVEIDEKLGHIDGQAFDFVNIAGVYADLGDWEKMRTFAERAYQLFSKVQHTCGAVLALNHLGESLRELGNSTEGLRLHKKALRMSRGCGDSKGESDSLRNLGLDFLALGEPDKAFKYLSGALKIANSSADWEGTIEANFALLRYFKLCENRDKFKAILLEIKRITENKGGIPTRRFKLFLDEPCWANLIYDTLGMEKK